MVNKINKERRCSKGARTPGGPQTKNRTGRELHLLEINLFKEGYTLRTICMSNIIFLYNSMF
jgi:hypothetical protein